MMDRAEKVSLKVFWDTLEQRLAAYTADDLRAILRAMAQEVSPGGRRAFLEKLRPVGDGVVVLALADQEGDLLADIDDFAAEYKDMMDSAGDRGAEYYEYGEYDEEDSLGHYEELVDPLVDLFDGAQAVFDGGDLALARQAYLRLFNLLDSEDDYGRGVRVGDLTGVDAGEARARYLRAIYETEPLPDRPQVLYAQMQRARTWLNGPRPTLDDLIQISPRPLPEQDRFLIDWIAFLRTQSGSDADAWLREAVQLAHGTPGLETLARDEGLVRPRAYLDWFTALEREGRHEVVLVEAREALRVLPPRLPIRAAVADHLCAAAARLGDVDALRLGRWEAFMAKPSLSRLLDLRDSVDPGTEGTLLMQRAFQYLQEFRARPPQQRPEANLFADRLESPVHATLSLLVHACLLAGDWDAAHELVAGAKVLGWSSSENPQGMVVSADMVVLAGRELNALPPNLAQFWQAALHNSSTAWGEWIGPGDAMLGRLERAYTEVFAQTHWNAVQEDRFLAWCLDVVQQRVSAIVGGKHRRSYDRAAMLTVACAEMLRLREDRAAADAFVDEIRRRFPRHSAFQAELRAAIQRGRGVA